MKLTLSIILLIITTLSLGQEKNTLALSFNMRLPQLAITGKLNYMLTERLELTAGVDGNAIICLGRVAGLQYKILETKKSGSLIFGCEYDYSSRGINSYYDDETGIAGSFSIPQNQYLVPRISWRYYQSRNKEKSISKGLSLNFSAMYKIPLNYKPGVFRSGDYSAEMERSLEKYINGGFNFELGVSFWFGKRVKNST